MATSPAFGHRSVDCADRGWTRWSSDILPHQQVSAEFGLLIWFSATALTFSPLFSWIGWLIALPPVTLALRLGWLGWVEALLIGAAAGAIAGSLAEIEAALPFGVGALLVLRAVLGRLLPI